MRAAPLFLLLMILPVRAEPWIAKDKQAHLAAGAALSVGGMLAAKRIGARRPELWGFGLALGVGLLKEAYDRRHPDRHTSDFNDASSTALGGAIVSLSWRF